MQALSILSMAFRLPGADGAEAFWSLLCSGRDAVREVPPGRFSFGEARNPSLSRRAAVLDDIRGFDPGFFGMSAEEAAWMDPQQRLMLELAVEALARAGLAEERAVGVFVGASHENFQELVIERMKAQVAPASTATGSLRNLIAARVAWQLDLQGPAVAVDSACSSTLLALHQGMQAIRAGECRYALVGGVHLMVNATPMAVMSRAGALSPSGVCRPFDPRADGFVIGEGAGLFLIGPPRPGALAHILASAVNNDGRTKHPMAPRPEGQLRALAAAWGQAGLSPGPGDAVEAHGTGTRVGDLVEAAGLAAFFPAGTPVGCVKSQVGHLMSAAGVPAIVRAILSFSHNALPPTLHGERTLPALGGLRVPREPEPWTGQHIGVNSFGFGGTNAHLILGRADGAQQGGWTSPFRRVPCWPDAPIQAVEGRFDPRGHPALLEHRVGGRAILPAAALLDAALRASGGRALRDVRLMRPVEGEFSVQVEGERWSIVAEGQVCAEGRLGPVGEAPVLREAEGESASPAELYRAMAARGMEHGPWFRRLESLRVGPHGALGALAGVADEHALHPGVFDAALQVVAATLPEDAPLQIPASFEEISVFGPAGGPLRVQALDRGDGAFDVAVFGAAPVAALRGFRLAPVGDAAERLDWELAEAVLLPPAAVLDAEVQDLPSLLAAIGALRARLGEGALVVRARGAFAGNPFAAALLGFAAALPAEHPGLQVFAVDGEAPPDRAPPGLSAWREGAFWRLAPRPALAPPRRLSGRWLVVGAGGGVGRELVRALLAAGVEVVGAGRTPQKIEGVSWIVGDAAEDFGALIDAAGPIDGVALLAGALRPGALARKDEAEIAEVLRPKVAAVAALARALDARGLDPEVVLSSSIAAEPRFAGGLIDYSAANLALDAMALARGPRWTSVRWGAWTVGMGQGSAGLPTVQTAAALRLWPGLRGGLWRVEGSARAAAAAPRGEGSAALRARIRGWAAALIGVEPDQIREEESLFSAGLDSLMAVDLVRRMEREGFGPLPATLVFQADTVRALAAFLEERAGAAAPQLPAAAAAGPFPFGRTQAALVRQVQLDPDFIPYAYLRVELAAAPELEALRSAVRAVVAAHELLRVSFAGAENAPRPAAEARVEAREALDEVALLNAPMEAPLQVVLAGKSVAFRLDHRAGDAWSLQNIAGEVLGGLRGVAPGGPDTAFRRFVAEDPPWTAAEAPPPHWLFAPTPAGRRAFISHTLPAGPSEALAERARALQLTLPALLLGAWARALSRWTAETRVVVNVAVARRERRIEGISSAVGCFADTVAMALEVGEDLAGAARLAGPRLQEALLSPPLHTAAPGFSFARFPGLPAEDAVVGITGATASAATRLGLAAWLFRGQLGFSLNFAEGMFHEDFVRETLAFFLEELGVTAEEDWLGPIAARAEAEPERPAVLGAEPLSFGALWARAGALAERLEGPFFPVKLPQGAAAVVALLASLRAGVAIVPVHPTDPPERVGRILAALGLERCAGEPLPAPARRRRSGWAYLIATSGTTGTPRLVPIPRYALRRYLDAAIARFGYGPDDRAVNPAPLAFDAAMRQILAPLLRGGAVLPVPPELARDPAALAAAMRQERVNVWSSVPALWERLAKEELPPMRLVQLGGEAMRGEHAVGAPVWNLYGPTEATLNATWHRVGPGEDPVPLGEPVPGAELQVVDGELWVGGALLTPGYWGGGGGRFVVRAGRRWFRTGDRVREEGGRLYWVGRVDDQLKIRGHRIESGEIVAALRALPGVREAAVFAEGDRVQARVTGQLPADARERLARVLPEVAIPAPILVVDELPRAASGKLDRAALRGADPVAEALAAAWREVLGVNPGPDSDFFAEGGNSLRALDLFERLHALPALPRPAALYETPRFAAFCEVLRGLEAPAPSDDAAWRPLGPVQIGFAMAGEEASALVGWRDFPPGVALRVPLEALQRRHPALRMEVEGRRWRAAELGLPLVEREAEAMESATQAEIAGLRGLPMGRWRAVVLRDGARTRLILGAHHAVGDARSLGILLRELEALLDGRPLPPLRPVLPPAPADPGRRPYWSGVLSGPLPALPAGPTRQEELVVPVKDPAAFLGALWRALVREIGSTDLRFGLVVDGREGAVGAVGAFAHLLPLRLRGPDAGAALRELRENLVPAGTLARWFPGRDPAELIGAAMLVSIFPDEGLNTVQAPPPPGSRLQLFARMRGEEAHLRLVTASAALDPGRLLRLLREALTPPEPLVGLVAYLPRGVKAPTDQPFPVGEVRTPLGRSRVVALPLDAARLGGAGEIAGPVRQAVERLRAGGVGLVSLAGLLPALTAFGEAVGAPRLTTGHAATVVAVVKTVEAVIERVGINGPISLGILGCGSIGLGALCALLPRLRPERVVLCDRPAARERLGPTLRETGASFTDDPNALGTRLIIGAASTPDILDVSRLLPGTLVVDDSFPPCFDHAAARERMARDGDVLLVGGGLLAFAAGELGVEPAPGMPQPRLFGLPGCQVEPLLFSQLPDPPRVRGPVQPEEVRLALALAEAFGLVAAPLHLGEALIDLPRLREPPG